jgi:hypothetical protein
MNVKTCTIDIRDIGMQVNKALTRNAACETRCVKVGLRGPNANDAVRAVDMVSYSVEGSIPGINATEILEFLVDETLTHWRYESGQFEHSH